MNSLETDHENSLVFIRMELAATLKVWVEVPPQETSGTPRLFHITFPGEIMVLSTMDASYVREQVEEPQGDELVISIGSSRFLDYVRTETYATSTFTHPLLHYRILTQEKVMDVATTTAPTIEEISL